MNKTIRPKIRIFVEGHAEKNYFEELARCVNAEFYIEPINMKGGGYKNFLLQVKKKGYLGCMAVCIIIDLDKIDKEKENFQMLLDYCRIQNKHCPIPYFLIGTFKDFEYFACCHCNSYKHTDTSHYITSKYRYNNVSDFKSDKNIYEFLNKGNRSFKIACEKLSKRSSYIENEFDMPKRKNGDIIIKIKKTNINEHVRNVKNSNIYEFFKIIGQVL